MKRLHPRGTALLSLTLLLAGCAPLGPDFQTPSQAAPAQWDEWSHAPRSAPPLSTATRQASAPAAWWQIFDDPVLDALQAQALSRNAELRSAEAEDARGDLRGADPRDLRQRRAAPQPALDGDDFFREEQILDGADFLRRHFFRMRKIKAQPLRSDVAPLLINVIT